MPRRIIIDTDPGKDDAAAILLALASPGLHVASVCAVAGNVPVATTAGNALKLLELGGRPDIPVYAGCPRPMLRPPVTAEHVHGNTGLGTLVLPPPRAAVQCQHAVEHLVSALRAADPGSVTLCLLGPATNLAMALVQAPDTAAGIAEVVWMAGARREGGNVTPAAEFNAYADPHAADVLLRAGLPLTLVPLDCTHQVQWTPARLDAMRRAGTAAARAVATLFSGEDGLPVGEPSGSPLHDPCVIAYVLDPTLFRGRSIHVAVETSSPLTLGATVADWHGVTGLQANAKWLDSADADGVFARLTQALARLP